MDQPKWTKILLENNEFNMYIGYDILHDLATSVDQLSLFYENHLVNIDSMINIQMIENRKTIYFDTKRLETLSTKQFLNEIAEIIKIGLVFSKELFEFIELNVEKIMNKDRLVMVELWKKTIEVKKPEFSSKSSFGWKIGNAIQQMKNKDLSYGECLSIGIMLEIELLKRKGFLINSNVLRYRLTNLFDSFNLPIKIPSDLCLKDLIKNIKTDERNFIILTEIGSVHLFDDQRIFIGERDLINFFDRNITIENPKKIMKTSINITVPGSKSLSNRVLLMCALGTGKCRIRNLLLSVDTQTMLMCLKQLRVVYDWDNDQTLIIEGTEGKLSPKDSNVFYLNNSGTTCRFLTSLCTILPNGTEIILTGDQRLKERPIKDLVDSLIENGNDIEYLNENEHLPIRIRSSGIFQGGQMNINADISSQYVTSLLLISPFASKSVHLKLNPNRRITSKPYIDMTLTLMKDRFGIKVNEIEPFLYKIDNSGSYPNPSDIEIEGDASSASYFLAIAAVHPGLTVTINNVGKNSLQGDSRFCKILEMMGCQLVQTETTTTITGPDCLTAISEEIDMNDMTDTFMTLACLSIFAKGTTRIRNIENQHFKECDRIRVTAEQLRKCSTEVLEKDSGLDIQGIQSENIEQTVTINCFNDHRIAMSFSIISSRLKNIVIDDKTCVDKTYPQFWCDLENIFGFKIESPSSNFT